MKKNTMVQIGHGYGSEWQLLRFLGHHRDLLESEITKQLKLSNGSHFKWLDFEFGDRTKSISGDEEIKGLNFLKKLVFLKNITSMPIPFDEYPSGWQNSQSWDAIVIINDTVYLVEAKAHIDEISVNEENNGGKSQEQIFSFMSEQLKAFGCTADIKKEKWLGKYYQMANRLAVAAYLNNKGIPTKVLYIYFENGYYKRGLDGKEPIIKDANRQKFENEIKTEKDELGIANDKKINELLCEVFINANPK